MACRRGAQRESVGQRSGFMPVQLHDFFGRIAPVFEVRTYAQRADHKVHFRLELLHGVVIEVVPMIVRNDEVIDLGDIGYVVALRAGETFVVNDTGEAWPLNTGSTRNFRPSTCMKYDEWPNQIRASVSASSRWRSVL